MSNEKFFLKLNKIIINKNSSLVGIKTSFQTLLIQESTQLLENTETARDKFFIFNLNLFQSESQSFFFTTSLSKYTVYSFKTFVVYCLPYLIELAGQKNDELNCQQSH